MIIDIISAPKTNYVMQLLAWNRVGESDRIEQQTFTTTETEHRAELLPPLQVKARVSDEQRLM